MPMITIDEAQIDLVRYLAAVENGAEFVIARDNKPVARLVPVLPRSAVARPRPKVGEILGEPFEFPIAAFAPVPAEERQEWGL